MRIRRFIARVRGLALLFGETFRPYRLHLAILTGLGFLGGFFEGIGINALIPLFGFIVGEAAADNIFTDIIRRAFDVLGISFTLTYLLLFMVALFLLKAAFLFASRYVQIAITTNYERSARAELFRRTFDASWPYLLGQRVGHLETVLLTDVRFAGSLLNALGSFVLIVTGLVIYLAVAVTISPEVTAFALFAGGLFLLAGKPLIRRSRAVTHDLIKIQKSVAHFVNESIIGAKAVKALAAASALARLAGERFAELRRLQILKFLFRDVAGSLVQPLSLVFVSVLFAVSYKSGDFNLGAFLALVYIIQRVFTYVQELNNDLNRINDGIPYLRSIARESAAARAARELSAGSAPFRFEREIRFEDVSFSYAPGRALLERVSFAIPKRSVLGIIGPSGAGKTTVVDLLLRLLSPSSGSISIDGEDVGAVSLESWREKVGYVSQDMFLANDTIASNIAFYRPAITRERIVRAARAAGALEFIEALPRGFDTEVGERGLALSVGQRQRLIIARALARDPELLILDEATSALDAEAERQVAETIEGLRGLVTVVIVAHRLSSVRACDTLVVLKGGRVVETGSPKDLLEKTDSYFRKVSLLQRRS